MNTKLNIYMFTFLYIYIYMDNGMDVTEGTASVLQTAILILFHFILFPLRS
jgi:hypothetical protein